MIASSRSVRTRSSRLDRDRHGHVRVQVLHTRDREELRSESRVREVPVGAERSAGREHETARPLAGSDQERAIVAVAGAGPLPEGKKVAVSVAQRDEGHVRAADLACSLGDPLQDRREVERRVDGPHDLRQELGLTLTPRGLFVEAGVLDGDGRLIRQERSEILFLGGEAVAMAEADDQRADRAIMMDQRQRDTGMQMSRLGEHTVSPARILLDVGDVFGMAREKHRAGDAAGVTRYRVGPDDAAGQLGSGPVAAALAQRLAALVDPDGAVGHRRHEPREAAQGGQPLGALVRLS